MNKKLPAQHTAKNGFTLLELLIVIVIIAVLMSLILPALSGVRRRANIVAVQTEMKQIEQALTTFENRFGNLPPKPDDSCGRRLVGCRESISCSRHVATI